MLIKACKIIGNPRNFNFPKFDLYDIIIILNSKIRYKKKLATINPYSSAIMEKMVDVLCEVYIS